MWSEMGTSSETTVSSQEKPLPVSLSADIAAELYRDGRAVIIDVRQDWELEEMRVPDSIHIPLGELPQRMDEVPTDQRVVLLCRSGNRSGQALTMLSEEGFDNVHNLMGGITTWHSQGHPVEP